MTKQTPIILFHTEEFKFEKVGKGKNEKVIISGNAQPLNEDSRNGVRYRPESVKKNFKSLNGVAFLFNHDTSKSLGHVTESGINETHMTYKADIDPAEKDYIRKVERGDIKHVSVGTMVENIEFNEEDEIYECDVKEYVELSGVTCAGFQNTSANKEGLYQEGALFLAEKLGDKTVIEKLKAKKEADDDKKKDDEGEDEDDKKDEGEDEDDKKDEEDDEDEKDSDSDKDSDEEEEAEDDEDDEDDDKDKDEKLKKKEDIEDKDLDFLDEKKENAGVDGEDEDSPEEQLKKVISRQEELFSKFDELINRLAIIESSVDALNDTEDSDADSKEDLKPNTEEKFIDKKATEKGRKVSKNELDAKEKAMTGTTSKKINEDKEVVDMSKTRMKDSY